MSEDPEESLGDGTWFLDGAAGTVSMARDRTRGFLGTCPLPISAQACADALLLVSELVANAVRHAPGPCALSLNLTQRALIIAVSDTAPTLPAPRAPDLRAGGGGFGWTLLRQLSQAVDVQSHPGEGKTITARLAIVPSGASGSGA
ncbi:ATP-binding protein [Streptacidiphilus sp. N1-12]|uniref:ATP-binding protein n=2 Tax=Streptacidiphilus alkalitolerans TaxID=3342712 RepID=A0ABV6V463_9ACTN